MTPARPRLLALSAAGALAVTAAGASTALAGTPTSASVAAPTRTGPSAPTATGSVEERCERDLPPIVLGDPQLKPGDPGGVRLWHDAAGWHLRVTHPGSRRVVFSGVISSGQAITAHPVRLEQGDVWRVGDGGRTLTFAFLDSGQIDGLDFTDACAIRTRFTFQRDGLELPPAAVDLGAHGAHPGTDPFVVRRTDAPA